MFERFSEGLGVLGTVEAGVELGEQQPHDVDQEHEVGQHGQTHRSRQRPGVQRLVDPAAVTCNLQHAADQILIMLH